jgi:cytochrome b561
MHPAVTVKMLEMLEAFQKHHRVDRDPTIQRMMKAFLEEYMEK